MPLPSRRNRSAAEPAVADVARRRLAGLRAQLAAERGEALAPPAALRPETPAPRRPTVEPEEVAEQDLAPVPGRHARRPVGPLSRCRDWCADRLPTVFGARPGLGSAQVGLVCLVVAVGLVAAAWWAMRANGGGGTVTPPRVTSAHPITHPITELSVSPTGSAAVQPAAASGGGQSGKIVVDVVGRVRHRGIVVLAAGSRVVDAVRAAGGLRPEVNRAAVNFARVLSDGEQLVVGGGAAPVAPTGAVPSATASPTTLVNINTADEATLETLPGIGPVTANAILQWRDQHGSFSSVDELLEVDGIGEATLADIAPLVTL